MAARHFDHLMFSIAPISDERFQWSFFQLELLYPLFSRVFHEMDLIERECAEHFRPEHVNAWLVSDVLLDEKSRIEPIFNSKINTVTLANAWHVLCSASRHGEKVETELCVRDQRVIPADVVEKKRWRRGY